MIRNALMVLVIGAALLFASGSSAGVYTFVDGYNVLDTNNAPVFAGGPVGTNYAGTAGLERDIAVDARRGIIYMGRGSGAVGDGRSGGGAAISAIVVTNGARAGSNFRDTGLIGAAGGQPTFGWCQSLAYDPGSDKVWVLGSPIGANPVIFTAPGGTLGGGPNGDNISAVNGAFVRAFQVDTNLLDVGVYVSPAVSTNGTPSRGGAPRGFAVRTVNGTNTTVFIGMGNHVQAWRNDQSTVGTNSPWRRIWATLRPPNGNLASSRVGLTGFNGVNGVAVDDAGNCYFSVSQSGGRMWQVRPELIQGLADPLSLDFNDLAFGGSNEREVIPLIITGSASAAVTNTPQGITFCRFDSQRSLFVSFIPGAAQRAVTRFDVDDGYSFLNGGAYLRAIAIDGFGSGQPAGGQDGILSSMRLKQASSSQPAGSLSNGLLYHDVDSVTNPAYIYFEAFVIDTNKDQTIPTATVGKVQIPVDTNPPSILVQPQPQTLLEGGSIGLSVGAAGQLPLLYQWQSNSVAIPNATNRNLTVVPASTNDTALYRVVVSNTLGSVTSTQVQVTVRPLTRSAAMTPLWNVAVGSRYYLTADDTQRGLAYNPNTFNVLVLSRSPSNAIHVLYSEDGSELFQMRADYPIISGGFFPVNTIGAAEDGRFYVANLALAGQTFRIYRYDGEEVSATPQLAYSGNPSAPVGNRWGDTLDVRGAGGTVQVLAGTRSSNVVAIFTSADGGATLTPTVVTVPGASNGAFGLGLAFGAGDTFWAKGDSSNGLRLVQFDLAHGTGAVLRAYGSNAYPATAIPIGVETNLNVLAAVSIENPDNLRLYNISDLDSGPFLVDQELFPSDNPNSNGTGAVDFGNGKVFALDSNNGLIALTLGTIPPPPGPAPGRIIVSRDGDTVMLSWTNSFTLQSATNVTGPYLDTAGPTNSYSETSSAPQKYFRLRN